MPLSLLSTPASRRALRPVSKPAGPAAGACSLLGALVLLAACGSTPMGGVSQAEGAAAVPAAGRAAAQPAAGTGAGQGVVPPGPEHAAALPPHRDPAHALSRQRVVYFGFDEVTLDALDLALLERHGRYLAAAPQLQVRIEGHADERGSAEYNLALGQRRAEAVRQALRVHGVREPQMDALSWGEERPAAAGRDEDAWAANRRAALVYR